MPVTRKPGAGAPGWTKARERRFLEHLAATSNIRAAERVAMVPAGSTYRRKDASPEFRAAFMAALAEGYTRLEFALLERAINGTPVTGFDRSGNKIERREYSEKLALTLLDRHRDTVAAIGAIDGDETAQERLARKLEEMGRGIVDAG
jgi:hypothetical protein